MLDAIFVTPNNSSGIYQNLSHKYAAIETPTWSLLLAQSCRSRGFTVEILDCLAEGLSDEQAFDRIKSKKPKIICFVVYGQNVNAGTTNMSGATRLSNFLKKKKCEQPIAYFGSHVQALPMETLKNETSIDLVFLNEGVYSIWNILSLNNINIENLSDINGIAYRDKHNKIKFNSPEKVVPNERMDRIFRLCMGLVAL